MFILMLHRMPSKCCVYTEVAWNDRYLRHRSLIVQAGPGGSKLVHRFELIAIYKTAKKWALGRR